MKKLLAGLLAALLLLTGCTVGDLARYPYVSQEKRQHHQTVTVAVPQEEWVLALGGQMTELVSAYSDGAVKLQLMPSEDPAELYRSGEAELLLCTGDELCRWESSLGWIRLPFLFPSPDEFLAAANAPGGPLRGTSVTVGETAGTLLGGFYDRGWMLAVRPQNGSIFAGVSFGADSRFGAGDLFRLAGAREIVSGTPQQLLQGEAGAAEFLPEEAEQAFPAGTKPVLSRHRTEGRFLIVREDVTDRAVLDCLLQALCETTAPAALQRMAAEEETLAAVLPGASGEYSRELLDAGQRMRRNYQFSPASYGLPEEAEQFLEPYF